MLFGEQEINFDEDSEVIFKCYSSMYLSDDERGNIDLGGKIILPQTVLQQLAEHTRIMQFKLKSSKSNRVTHCGVLQFIESTEPVCYLPRWMMKYLQLDDGDDIHISLVQLLPLATFVRFKPLTKLFYDISNPKAVLERALRAFSCLTKGDIVTINYLNHDYELSVLELKPSNVVSIIECDVEVDFAPFDDENIETNQISSKLNKITSKLKKNRIDGKIISGNNEQQDIVDLSQMRGIPNYNYEHGLLQFPRTTIYSLDDDRDEGLDNSASKKFQPFTGEGNTLRQPRPNKTITKN